MSGERILVVDDDWGICRTLRHLLERQNYEVETVQSGEQALELLDSWRPDLVLTDLTMSGMSGIDLLRHVKAACAKDGRDVPVIVITAYSSVSSAVEAMKEGAFEYVGKPFSNDELKLTILRALNLKRLEADHARLQIAVEGRYQLGEFVGRSAGMQVVYDMVRRVMGTRISCLIGGESGTGKELLAKSIHYGSERANGPFVPVNCGAVSESLFESELFGHRKGAFTGAMRDKPGFFAAANGGTLFLDEVGEMPPAAQVKVLRALSERKVTPVGATMEEAVDVRIIAATNRNLAAEVKAGRFREDLYYRLNVVQIDLPPLRERPEDIDLLASHFVSKFALEYGKPVRGLTPECQRMLRAYPFPGNVRELQNVLERAVALESGALVSPSSLPDHVQGALRATRDELVPPPLETGIDLEARLAAVERRYIDDALEAAHGNRTAAAKLLGISFRSLRYRLVKFGMEPGDPVE